MSDILVIGGGIVGLCVAHRLQAEGARVTLFDEGAASPNASAVAAGMLAPASEAAMDPVTRGRLALLRAARDLWPETAGDTIPLYRDGATAVALAGEPDGLDAIGSELDREGAAYARLTAEALRARHPLLSAQAAVGLHTPDDWHVEPEDALGSITERYLVAGGEVRRGTLDPASLGRTKAAAVVLCAGWGSRRFVDIAPELSALTPIKGQLIRFRDAPPFDGPVLRRGGRYLVPSRYGVLSGASMELGRDDLQPDEAVTVQLAESARAVLPHLRAIAPESRVGVRAATPDGLPLIGRSEGGLYLATGFRRNGWLLAPLAARITADLIANRDPGAWADVMRPDRFVNRART